MSTQAVICYPSSFLERPEDRSFLIELSFVSIPKDTARLILYRIWADFATGGSDRRQIDAENLEQDRQVRVLENFCEWSGRAGELVRMAVGAGFLTVERGESATMLVCKGFYPTNSAWNAKGRGFQKRGGLSRVLKVHGEKADGDVEELEKLWARTGNPFTDIDPEILLHATRLICRICRTLAIKNPTATELQSGIMRMAIELVQASDEAQIKETLLWLLSRRKEPDMPDRLDVILRAWPGYVEKAKSEGV